MYPLPKSLTPRRMLLFVGLTVTLFIASLVAFPPVRAIADQILQVFRVQQVVFVPINPDRLDQLDSLDFDETTLLLGEPQFIHEPADPVEVATPDEAMAMTGYALRSPTSLPSEPLTHTITVIDQHHAQFSVKVESAQQLLELLEITDVTIPPALSNGPVDVQMPISVHQIYQNESYQLHLYQGLLPDITPPDGVDMQQLGIIYLRVLGMDMLQAEALSRDIDWNTTLVMPFPSDMTTIRQVRVNDADGLLITSRHQRRAQTDEPTAQLYWQDGDRFLVLAGSGFSSDDLLTIAQSVR